MSRGSCRPPPYASIFDFPEFKPPVLTSMPVTVNGNELHAYGGNTYPFKDYFKSIGYKFMRDVEGLENYSLWVGDAAACEEFEEKANAYGFSIDAYDGVGDADDAA